MEHGYSRIINSDTVIPKTKLWDHENREKHETERSR